MKRALVLLAACGARPAATVSQTAPQPPGVRIVVADKAGVALQDLDGRILARWTAAEANTAIGALPDHRGVVVMTFDGRMRIVTPTADRAIGTVSMQMACGGEGVSSLDVKLARVSADGRAACLEMSAILAGEIQVEATIDLATGTEYLHKVGAANGCGVNEQRPPAGLGCAPRVAPLVKNLEIEGDTFDLVGISPTRRWEIYEGPRSHVSSYESAPILVVDTIAKQRYALATGPWPAALSPARKVTGAWASNPQITWLADDIAEIDQDALVELGKRVSLPGSFIRW